MIKILIAIVVLLIIYLYYENNYLCITKYNIKNNKKINNYKIVHISDYHNYNGKLLNKRLINSIIKTKPDIIVISGDFIDSRKTNTTVALELAKKLVLIAPVYYSPGNHEARIDEYNDFKKELVNLKVHVLENKKEKLLDNMYISGILDPSFKEKKATHYDKIVKNYMDEMNINKNCYNILIAHRPELFNSYISKNIDLVFSGHAHGGQVRLSFVGGLFSPGQGLFPIYTSGIHKDKKTTMVISRGIGKSVFPFRINNRPELVVVTIST